MPSGGIELRRKWTATLVIGGFLAGLTLCLIPHFDGHDHGSGAPSTVTHTAQACGTSVLVAEHQKISGPLPLTSLLSAEQNSFYGNVSLRPPFPPPRV